MRTQIAIVIALLCCGVYNGHAQTISGVVNNYYHISAINTATNTLTLSNTTGLSPGMKVLIIQMKGATIDNTNASSYGDITAENDAGNYEFNIVCTVSGNDVLLQYHLLNSYTVSGTVQLVSVPVYASVTVAGLTSATAWDPVTGTGGVVAIEATDTVYLNSNIDVSGQGFQGGALKNYPVPPYDCSWAATVNQFFLSDPGSSYYTGGKKGEGITDYILNQEYGKGKLSSGGGGGNNANTGGGGGGNIGTGGNGGQRSNESTFSCHGKNPGVGGLSLSPYGYMLGNNRIFFGGGGGSGHENNGVGTPGGNGGGIIIITAPVISGTGTSLIADGSLPVNPGNSNPNAAEGDGGGGGGAGGTIIINATKVVGSITASAQGARGSDASNNINDCTGPGGGGGGGMVWAAGSSFPGTVTPAVTGGSNGLVSMTSSIVACRGLANGATAGANGTTNTNYIAPVATGPVCVPLAIAPLKFFKAKANDAVTELSWAFNAGNDVDRYQLQRSLNGENFSALTPMLMPENATGSFSDADAYNGMAWYRIQFRDKLGNILYSNVITISRSAMLSLNVAGLRPNPVHTQLHISISSKTKTVVQAAIYNSYGQMVSAYNWPLLNGINNMSADVDAFPAGTYFIRVWNGTDQCSGAFIKK